MPIDAYANQSATYEAPNTHRDSNGRIRLGSAIPIKIRFERVYKTVATGNNEVAIISGEAFIPLTYSVVEGGRITYENRQYRVFSIEDQILDNGKKHHREAMLQAWTFS